MTGPNLPQDLATGMPAEGTTQGMYLGRSTETGIAYAFCDSTCMTRYKKSPMATWKPREVRDAKPTDLGWPRACLYCRWCGMLVFDIRECELHGVEECPGYSWLHSGQAHAFVVHFILRSGRRRVPDYLMDQAEELSLVHPGLAGELIAEMVIDSL